MLPFANLTQIVSCLRAYGKELGEMIGNLPKIVTLVKKRGINHSKAGAYGGYPFIINKLLDSNFRISYTFFNVENKALNIVPTKLPTKYGTAGAKYTTADHR